MGMSFTEACLQSHELRNYWCGICQGFSEGLCRNYVGCKEYHHFNICEDCARKEGYGVSSQEQLAFARQERLDVKVARLYDLSDEG